MIESNHTTRPPATLVEAEDGSRSVGQLRAAPGVLVRGDKTYLVEQLFWFGERVGHLRGFSYQGQERARWVVYGAALGEREGADVVGDEATELEALMMCRRFLLGHLMPREVLIPSPRTVGPSSRTPGAGPTEGTTYRTRDALSVEQRNARGADLMAVLAAAGEERERLAEAFSWKWGVKPALPLGVEHAP